MDRNLKGSSLNEYFDKSLHDTSEILIYDSSNENMI